MAPTGDASCLAAPRAPHLTSTTTRAHACPDIVSLGDPSQLDCLNSLAEFSLMSAGPFQKTYAIRLYSICV